MSNYAYGNVPASFDTRYTQFTVGNTTIAKVLVEAQASAAASGNNPLFIGGFSLLELLASSTDAAAKDIIIWEGEVLTTQDATNTGALATATSSTITRATSTPQSFITDGWKVGDALMVFTPDNSAQVGTGIDGIKAILTGVAAGTLTVNGTPFSTGTLTAGTRLVRVSQLARHTIAINAGNTATASGTPNVNLLNQSMDISTFKNDRKFGSTAMIIGGLQANASALPAQISVLARYAKY